MVNEYYEILLSACRAEEIPLRIRYKQVRDLLERLCREQMQNESLQMTDLAARINYLANQTGLSTKEQNRLHTFRLTSNAILNWQKEPQQDEFFRDVKTLAFFVKRLSRNDIPQELYRLLPKADATYLVNPPSKRKITRMRVCFQYADEQFLYVNPVDTVAEEPLKVRYGVEQINQEFDGTCQQLWRYAQVNLLDVFEDEEGILTPAFIVLEPDYLIDISTLAECFKDYGHHPGNYIIHKLQSIGNTRPLLLGNIANLFLDEWIHADGEIDYRVCMQKAFRKYPIELAACEDLRDPDKERQFFEDCRKHFDHIRATVCEAFPMEGYKLDKTDAVLEPSYICEALGLQGRLDYMQRDMKSLIEMKSGKADEYSLHNKIEPKENNRVQMLLYQAVLQYSMGVHHNDLQTYLLYTRYPLLYPARASWAMVKRAIDLRNRIVADEYGIQLRNSIDYTRRKLNALTADVLNERKLTGRFWMQYLRPPIDRLHEKMTSLTPLESAYVFALYNFITKEQYTSKSGDVDYEGRTGASALWLASLAEKKEAGEILYDLHIAENHAADEQKASLVLTYNNVRAKPSPDEEVEALPNFRLGDAIVLYERNLETDNVTNKMIFKGNIESLAEGEITVRLRATQQNTHVLPAESLYAIEHDTMDTAFRSMFTGLATFLEANKERRELLLAQRKPAYDASCEERIGTAPDDLARIVLKAQAARDYFLLVGPPGTGKTSQALRRMVEAFHAEKETQILLLAYTNRAVDEICKALLHIAPAVDFIRVGSELSCDEAYRSYLIENVLNDCTRRTEVTNRIVRCRIIVGTVATLSNRPEIFKLKTFDVAIVDEATQILEPQILGLLCAKNNTGANAIGKFILIGDPKQLPAVVLQTAQQTEIYDDALREIGLLNLRDSLFERLYRASKGTAVCDQLCRQGRMHPLVAEFPNRFFYGNQLQTLGLPHQVDALPQTAGTLAGGIDPMLVRRVAYFPSVAEKSGSSAKINHCEAQMVAGFAGMIHALYDQEFDPARTLGVITPYRSQIALIKREIAKLGIPCLNKILVDTVERFQGSERDVIIYSFCINHIYQLRYLANVIREDGVLIDRKLNVALTRARKQMFIIGVKEMLQHNKLYSNLLNLGNI